MGTLARLRLTPQFSGFVAKGRIQSVDVVFRSGQTARETLRFQNRSTEDGMLVDCGEDGYPVGLQFISAEGIENPSGKQTPIGENTYDDLVHCLFVFATEMIRFTEAARRKRGNDLVEETLELIKQVPSDKIKQEELVVV